MFTLNPIPVPKKKKMSELVIEQLKVMVEAEGIDPGDRFPTEQELVKIFGVSRTSVREALSILNQAGYLEIVQGKGIFLKHYFSDTPFDLQMTKTSNEDHLSHLIEARKAVECELAFLATKRATDEDISLMESALEKIRGENTTDLVFQYDMDFHYNMAKAARNPVLFKILMQIDKSLKTGRKTTLKFPQGRKKAFEGHKRVLNAIKDQDPDLARKEMLYHINQIEQAQKNIIALKESKNTSSEK